MGKCKYCGLSAGFFSHAHKECELKHQIGMKVLLDAINAFFKGIENISLVLSNIALTKQENFLSQEDVEDCCRQGLNQFCDNIHLPITKEYIKNVDIFLNNIGFLKSTLNKEGELDRLGQRIYQGLLTSFFVEQQPISKVEKRTQILSSLLPLTTTMKEEVGLSVLDKAAGKFLDDGLISANEQSLLDDFIHSLNLPVHNLPLKFKGSSIEKIQQASILRQIQNGILPVGHPTNLPILLSQGESVIWCYDDITMYQEKITREWVGRHSGMSFRVMKGVYYRTGGSKGHPVERSTMENVGSGSLILTNKNICFHSSTRTLKIPFKKIVGMTPYSDGIEIHQDGAKAQRLVFQGFDSWFMVNLLSYINV